MKEAVSKELFVLYALPPEYPLNFSGLHVRIFKEMEIFLSTSVTASNPTRNYILLCEI
jgi:hypothetical protein